MPKFLAQTHFFFRHSQTQLPRGSQKPQKPPGSAERSQEPTEAPRSHPEAPEAPRKPRSPQEPTEAPRGHQKPEAQEHPKPMETTGGGHGSTAARLELALARPEPERAPKH